MIIKWVIDNHDAIRESDKAILLRVNHDHYCWIPTQFIEPFALCQQSKIIVPDDIRFKLLKGNMNTLWCIENETHLIDLGTVPVKTIKTMYYRYHNFKI